MLSSVLAKAAPALKLNEHIEADGATVFRHACRMGLRRHRVEAKEFAIPFRAVTRLAQNEEPGMRGGAARGGGGGFGNP